MPLWGNDGPVLGPDDDKTAKGRSAAGGDTFNMVSAYCTECKAEDGVHTPSCSQNN